MANKVKPTNAIRCLVSKKKRRFQEKGFDLDLSYITDRIIAMGFPSESIEGIFRNPMTEVQRFLDSLHTDKYKVYNLCAERKYDHKKFKGRVYEFPFEDHNPCPLALIPVFCSNVAEWLDQDPQNVAVIHCKAGKGRTGMLICCILQYYGICRTASEALQLFAARRTVNCSGVTLHSQRRYVRYYETILQDGMPPSMTLQLKKIRMHTIPDFLKGGGSEPWFSISSFGATIYYSDPLKGKKGNQVVDFDCGNTTVTDDIKIAFFHRNLKGLMFYFWIHCSFIKDNYYCLRKRELEKACKDKQCKHFAPGFKIELFFQSADGGMTSTHSDSSDDQRDSLTLSIDKRESSLGICCGCNEKILPTQSNMVLQNGIYHFECIRCIKCGKNMKAGKNCIIKDGKATCDRCEGDEFFSKCSACFRSLVGNSNSLISVKDHSYHPDCFRCLYCQRLIDYKKTQEYVMQEEKVFCKDHIGLYSNLCSSSQCTTPDRNSEKVYALGRYWHLECFRCSECDRLLDAINDEYVDRESLPACKDHKPRFCFKCQKQIFQSKNTVSAFGEIWHPPCFRCAEHGCGLTWEHQTTMIEENMQFRDNQIVCKSHHHEICHGCDKSIASSDLLIVDQTSTTWHKLCFVCELCHKVLRPDLDSFTFMDDHFPLCTSHQKLCSICAKPIVTTGDRISLGNTCYFHSQCFRCQLEGCGRTLTSSTFIEVDGRFYCTTHPHCGNCKRVISDADLFQNDDGQFHRWCYRCQRCQSPLISDQCEVYNNQLLCYACHPSPKCDMCNRVIFEGHIALLDRHYHDQCFKCANCFTPFATISESVMVSSDGKPLCHNCCSDTYVRCVTCGLPISDQIIEAIGKSYHPKCFTCARCKRQLLKSFGLSTNNEICCTECLNNASRQPTCFACGQLLKGKYTIAAGRNYHFECFKCAMCSSPFGKGEYFRVGDNLCCNNCSAQQLSNPSYLPPAMDRTYSTPPPVNNNNNFQNNNVNRNMSNNNNNNNRNTNYKPQQDNNNNNGSTAGGRSNSFSTAKPNPNNINGKPSFNNYRKGTVGDNPNTPNHNILPPSHPLSVPQQRNLQNRVNIPNQQRPNSPNTNNNNINNRGTPPPGNTARTPGGQVSPRSLPVPK